MTTEINSELLAEQFEKLQLTSLSLRQEPWKERVLRLQKLKKWILHNRELIKEAVHSDFRKPLSEVDVTEIYPIVSEIRHTIKYLPRWVTSKKVNTPLSLLGTNSEIRYEPKGVCLIISPWNFPFSLCVGPLISCIAAGNTAIVKPSEMTPHTSRLIKTMIDEVFDSNHVCAVEGGVESAQALLKFPFNHIFFTGSPEVGKIVMKAASNHLASVTLELGGKSPVIIDSNSDLKDSAKRIAFWKFMNNGQICIAPDYILIDKSVKDKFIELLRHEILVMFGDGNQVNEGSEHYARIVNSKHFLRVKNLLDDAISKGAKAEIEYQINEDTNFISPILLSNVPNDSLVMQEEIFGPILPILTFSSKEEVIKFINLRQKPLALYIFTKSKTFSEFILMNTSSGGACINECVLHYSNPNLPFGGTNNSGIGKSSGHFGFLEFSNEKAVLKQKSGWNGAYLFHPPYKEKLKKIVNFMVKWL